MNESDCLWNDGKISTNFEHKPIFLFIQRFIMKESHNKIKQSKTNSTQVTHWEHTQIISLIFTLTLFLSSCAVSTHVSSPSPSLLLPTAADTPTAGKTTHRPPLAHSGSAAHRSAVTNIVRTAPHCVCHDHRLAGRCRGEETLFEHVMSRGGWGVPCADCRALHRWCEASSSAGMATLPVWLGDENKSHKKFVSRKTFVCSSPAQQGAMSSGVREGVRIFGVRRRGSSPRKEDAWRCTSEEKGFCVFPFCASPSPPPTRQQARKQSTRNMHGTSLAFPGRTAVPTASGWASSSLPSSSVILGAGRTDLSEGGVCRGPSWSEQSIAERILAEFNNSGIGMMLTVLWCAGSLHLLVGGQQKRDSKPNEGKALSCLWFFSFSLIFFLSIFDKNVMNADVSVIALVRRDVNGDRE